MEIVVLGTISRADKKVFFSARPEKSKYLFKSLNTEDSKHR